MQGAQFTSAPKKQLYTMKKSILEYHLPPKKTKTTISDDANYVVLYLGSLGGVMAMPIAEAPF